MDWKKESDSKSSINERLKQLITTKPILKITNPHKDFVVCIDASLEVLWGVLLQHDYLVSYESWKLKSHENNYATHDLELITIVHALKMWWHYLLGRIFLLKADNISLKYFSINIT
jgi:hypothetical protein